MEVIILVLVLVVLAISGAILGLTAYSLSSRNE